MSLPRLAVLTDRTQLPDGRTLSRQLQRCTDAGLRMVVLRELDLPSDERVALIREIRAVVPADVLLLTSRLRLPGADGVHLGAASGLVVDGTTGISCHDDAEVVRAVRRQVDYVTVSPVAPTRSKPGYGPVLGVEGVRRAVDSAGGVPVLALGGVDEDNAARLRAGGAHGVAVMGAVMRAADPGTKVAALLHELCS